MSRLRRSSAQAQDDAPVSVASMPTLATGPAGNGPLGFVDHYSFVRKLGGGGFGMVFLARDTVSGIDVAIKTLHPLLRRDAAEMQNLRAKFALVSRLAHPSIATALVLHTARSVDFRDPDTAAELGISPGDNMMVMRYAPGVSLSQWRRQFDGSIVPPDDVVAVSRQLASALDYAHGEKIVHRDIKPSNIMVETLLAAEPRGASDHEVENAGGASSPSEPDRQPLKPSDRQTKLCVRLLDFGLAAEIRSSMSRVSNEKGDTSGTRPYMAPEQWSGRPQDGRTDQYALACVAYEMLCGAPPFAGVFDTGDPAIMRSAVMFEPPARILGLSRAANAALARALAKRPEDRFESCAEFVESLASGIGSSGQIAPVALWNRLFASDRSASRRDPVSAITVNSALDRTTPFADGPPSSRMAPQPRGSSLRVGCVVAVAAVATAAAVFFAFRHGDLLRKNPVDTAALVSEIDDIREKAKEKKARFERLGDWSGPDWNAHRAAFHEAADCIASAPVTEKGLDDAERSLVALDREIKWLEEEGRRLAEEKRREEERMARLAELAAAKREGADAAARILPVFRQWDDPAFSGALREADAAASALGAIPDDADGSLDDARNLVDSIATNVSWMAANAEIREALAKQEDRFADLSAMAEEDGSRSVADAAPEFDKADSAAAEARSLRDNGDYVAASQRLGSATNALSAAMEKARWTREMEDEERRKAETAALAISENAFAALGPEARRVGVRDVATNTCVRIDELLADSALKRDAGDLVGAREDFELARYMLARAIEGVKSEKAARGVEIAEGFRREARWRECLEAAESVLSNWDPRNDRARVLKSEAWDHIHFGRGEPRTGDSAAATKSR